MHAIRNGRWGRWLWAAAGIGALAGTALLARWLIRNDAAVYIALANKWLADTVIERLGYWGVFVLMAIESSVIPVPSELVMPPAGDLARRLPNWTLGGVILMGTLGSLAGSLVNYALARYVGRMIVVRLVAAYGRYVHLSLDGYLASERFFYRHGSFSVFIGRLLPGVRHLISVPAGLSRMPLARFCLLTTAGAGAWCAFLAGLGYWFGSDPQLLAAMMNRYSHWLVAAAVAGVAAYVAYVYWMRPRAPLPGPAPAQQD